LGRDSILRFWRGMKGGGVKGGFLEWLDSASLEVGNGPELREVLIRVVKKSRMSPKLSRKREDGIGSRHCLDAKSR